MNCLLCVIKNFIPVSDHYWTSTILVPKDNLEKYSKNE
jgi:hypothetical protein